MSLKEVSIERFKRGGSFARRICVSEVCVCVLEGVVDGDVEGSSSSLSRILPSRSIDGDEGNDGNVDNEPERLSKEFDSSS